MTTCDLCGRVTMGHAADEMPGEVCAERDGFSCVRRQLRRERTAREAAERERDAAIGREVALYNAVEDAINAALGDEWGDADNFESPHDFAAAIGKVAGERNREIDHAIDMERERDAALAERDRLRARVEELEKNDGR